MGTRGISVWQFKRGDLPPAKCREELRGAKWARELLEERAAYRLVLGRRLTPEKIARRKAALVSEAKELGLPADPGQFHVFDANRIAAWASQFPALAVSQLLGGPGYGAADFDLWSRSNRHQTEWVSSDDREAEIAQIRSDIVSQEKLDIRVWGESGRGKTRLVLEALRATDWEPLVAYVADAESLSPEFLNHAMAPTRAAVLVIDECEARRHEKLAERIPTDSLLRLISIGQDGSFPLRSPILEPKPLADDSLEEFLRRNYPALGGEARRFVVAHANGNVRWAMILAERIGSAEASFAAELIRQDDIEQLTTQLIPEGRPFFLASVLALFERVGWDREVRSELDIVAEFAAAPTSEFDALAIELERRGMLVRQGRYRAIVPHPLAVVLAADSWKHWATKIVNELLPKLSREMLLSLLSRVTHLGTYEPAMAVLRELMTTDAPFGSLESIDSNNLGAFIPKLAVVLPDETAQHLSVLIESEPVDSLRAQTRSRRDLVWALEKLVWHSRTFDRAADCLLKLALAENETYGNNSTGIWISLFAAGLPATAAPPVRRLEYLQGCVSQAEDVQALVVKACATNLDPHEHVMVSGELQGGVLVEPRGHVSSAEEGLEYRARLIELLGTLHRNASPAVSTEAAKGLVSAVHPLIDQPIAGPVLRRVLSELRNSHLGHLRKEMEKLRSLFRQHPNPSLLKALDELDAILPEETPIDRVSVLTEIDPWSFQDEDNDNEAELESLIAELDARGELKSVLSLLSDRELASGWHLGRALARTLPNGAFIDTLVGAAATNLTTLAGYLSGKLSEGDKGAFENFLKSERAHSLTDNDALALAVRGPATEASKEHVRNLLTRVPVREGAVRLFSWQQHFSAEEVDEIVRHWLGRMEVQSDYSAAVDWLNLWFHKQKQVPEVLRESVMDLLLMRRDFPDLGQQGWDWARLAGVVHLSDPTKLASLVLDLVSDGMLLHSSSEEAELLSQCADSDPEGVWALIAGRLETGDWRLAMSLRGWITQHIPVAILASWVDQRLDRARWLAEVASAGKEAPTDEAEYLLSEFGDDDDVRASLAGEFLEGTWWGSWSNRIREQIGDLEAWHATSNSRGVRKWAETMRAQLERNLELAIEREAEDFS